MLRGMTDDANELDADELDEDDLDEDGARAAVHARRGELSPRARCMERMSGPRHKATVATIPNPAGGPHAARSSSISSPINILEQTTTLTGGCPPKDFVDVQRAVFPATTPAGRQVVRGTQTRSGRSSCYT
jgi:hypothetical protein